MGETRVDLQHLLEFEPLLDPAFDDLLGRHYTRGIAFEVDGQVLPRQSASREDRVIVPIRLGRRRIPSAIATLEQRDKPAMSDGGNDREGIAVSTFGKVIKSGWDWLGLTPATPSRVSGLIEAPDLAGCLTLNKNDFIRTGPRGATYLAYRTGSLFANMRSGDGGEAGDVEGAMTPSDELPPGAAPGSPSTPPGEHEPAPEPLTDDTIAGALSPTALPTPVGTFATVPGRRRPGRYGLLLQFESRPHDSELGRLVDSTIWINEAHPAYARAAASRSAGYHIALTVALALAPLAVGARDEHAFITLFLAHWGGSESKKTRRRRHRG